MKLVFGDPSPLQVTIDCSSEEARSSLSNAKSAELHKTNPNEVNSFCNLIHNAVPKAVKDGRFVLDANEDQIGHSNEPVRTAVAPPNGFIPKLHFSKRKPKLIIPRMKIPKLKPRGPIKAPRVREPMSFTAWRRALIEESSSERMERFKKGVERMLRIVKVLGQVDQYLSERTRIVIDKLSKTLAE